MSGEWGMNGSKRRGHVCAGLNVVVAARGIPAIWCAKCVGGLVRSLRERGTREAEGRTCRAARRAGGVSSSQLPVSEPRSVCSPAVVSSLSSPSSPPIAARRQPRR